MNRIGIRATLVGVAITALLPPAHGAAQHTMPTVSLGSGWQLSSMAQVFPVVTVGAPGGVRGDALSHTGWYLTQPAVMAHLAGRDQRVVVHATLNFEGLTQPDGELTFGGWGEGFLDKRHPHTLLHELMVSMNTWDVGGSAVSLSLGKGFAPYGTSDPMARPGLKYPTNHHLSQILERWTVNASWARGAWSLEAGVFGGQEPEGVYDLSNIESFGDSWSARLARRWEGPSGGATQWEASASFASVTELAHTVDETTYLANAALLRSGPLGSGNLYVLAEASRSFLADHPSFFSVLAEARFDDGRRQPYLRVELAGRPEYDRDGSAGEADFFRYEHDDDPVGRTHWMILTAAWAQQATPNPWSIRPFLEVQYHRVAADRGPSARQIFGGTSFWALSAGVRVLLGGDPMRMGTYGVLDPMTAMSRSTPAAGAAHVH